MTRLRLAAAAGIAGVLGTLLVPVIVRSLPQDPSVAYGVGQGAAAKISADVCASCHGANLAGDRSASLLDDTWSFRRRRRQPRREHPRRARPSAGMPPFKGALTERQIASLVVFIREQGEAGGAPPAQPAPSVEIGRVFESERQAFRLETVVDGLETPGASSSCPTDA